MKHMKISCSFLLLSSSFIIYSVFLAFQSVEPNTIQGLNESPYSKSQNILQDNNSSATTENNILTPLIFSNPFYISNTTLIFEKIPFEKSNSTCSEVQFFIERGVINSSSITYNAGYYMEDTINSGTNSKIKHLGTGSTTESSTNYAKGSGIFLTENGGVIKWDAFDQIINKSDPDGNIIYAGMIFFSPIDGKNNELAFLKNRVGLYEFSIDPDAISPQSTSTASTGTATNTAITTHRSIWLWPQMH